MTKTKTYSPADVTVIIGENIIIDTFNTIEIAEAEDKISHSVASTGQSTRIINASKLGTITLNLPQTTQRNEDILKEYKAVLDDYAKGKFTSIDVQDKLGNSKHRIQNASIKKVADSNYEKEDTDRSWAFEGDMTKNEPKGNVY